MQTALIPLKDIPFINNKEIEHSIIISKRTLLLKLTYKQNLIQKKKNKKDNWQEEFQNAQEEAQHSQSKTL